MKRLKRQKKASAASFTEEVKGAVIKHSVGVASFLVLTVVLYFLGSAYVSQSNYFRLRTVETRCMFLDQKTVSSINSQILNLYKGFNIFSVNMNSIAAFLRRSYPDAKEVTVKIVLPDKLLASLKFRKPVAAVRSGKLFPIDDEGFVLPRVDSSLLTTLPIIDGVSLRYEERKGGKTVARNLALALDLLKEIRRERFMGQYGLDTIDASDPKNISFYLKNGIEVKIGGEEFRSRLDVLERTLKDPRLLLDRIRYIDLRFSDVMIGPK